jgi:hypothetical protein
MLAVLAIPPIPRGPVSSPRLTDPIWQRSVGVSFRLNPTGLTRCNGRRGPASFEGRNYFLKRLRLSRRGRFFVLGAVMLTPPVAAIYWLRSPWPALADKGSLRAPERVALADS